MSCSNRCNKLDRITEKNDRSNLSLSQSIHTLLIIPPVYKSTLLRKTRFVSTWFVAILPNDQCKSWMHYHYSNIEKIIMLLLLRSSTQIVFLGHRDLPKSESVKCRSVASIGVGQVPPHLPEINSHFSIAYLLHS